MGHHGGDGIADKAVIYDAPGCRAGLPPGTRTVVLPGGLVLLPVTGDRGWTSGETASTARTKKTVGSPGRRSPGLRCMACRSSPAACSTACEAT